MDGKREEDALPPIKWNPDCITYVPSTSDALPDRQKPPLFVMIDGEFTGPHFITNGTLAWALVAFTKPSPDRMQKGLPHIASLEIDSLCVRFKQGADVETDPETKLWWAQPANQKLLEWTRRDTVSPKKGMALISKWCHALASKYRLTFVAKPTGIDVGRFSSDMSRFGGPRAYIPRFNTICLSSQMTILLKMFRMTRRDFGNTLLCWKARMGIVPGRRHFPLNDCRAQIAEFMAMDFMACFGHVVPTMSATVEDESVMDSGSLSSGSPPSSAFA